MTTKNYENITWDQFQGFLKIAFENGFKATEQVEHFDNQTANGTLSGKGITVSYTLQNQELQVNLISKKGLAYFFSDEKIFEIMDQYAGINN